MTDGEYQELVKLAENKGLSGKENVDLYLSLGMNYNEITRRIRRNTTGHILQDKNGFKGTLFDYSQIYGINVSTIKYHLKNFNYQIGDIIDHVNNLSLFLKIEIDGKLLNFNNLQEVLNYLNITEYQWNYFRRKKGPDLNDVFCYIMNRKVELFNFRGETNKLSYFINKYKITHDRSKSIKNDQDLKFHVEELEKIRQSKIEFKTKYDETITIEELEQFNLKRNNVIRQIRRGWNKNKIFNNEMGLKVSKQRNKPIEIGGKLYTLKELKEIIPSGSIKSSIQLLSLKNQKEYYIKYLNIHLEIIKLFDLQYYSLTLLHERLIKLDRIKNELSFVDFFEILKEKDYLNWKFNENELKYISGKINFQDYKRIVKNVKTNDFKYEYDGKIFKTKTSLSKYLGAKDGTLSFDPPSKRLRTFVNYKGEEIALSKVLYDLNVPPKTIASICNYYNGDQINALLILYSTKPFQILGKEFADFNKFSEFYGAKSNYFIRKLLPKRDYEFNPETLLQDYINYIETVQEAPRLNYVEYSYIRKDSTLFKSKVFTILCKEFYETSPDRLRKYLRENEYNLQKFYDEEYAPLRVYLDKSGKMQNLKIKELALQENINIKKLNNFYNFNGKNAQNLYDNLEDIRYGNFVEIDNKFLGYTEFMDLDVHFKFSKEISFNMLKSGIKIEKLLAD